ncbi:GAF domain-containing protein [Limnofasciculus baicalensis]|uniref:histidine kinase n=1 Tax=Limnofasciculus baicalensis BBK-W-15 TaxID=2699891 RepID=A0AAE3GP86_9CYAN|nr:GAF domain-containing protein [Limnofasciculus baicalensis]MCP2728201.1 ATP-binding protein [Limnofasciculus baicalensis BBK-W-15]
MKTVVFENGAVRLKDRYRHHQINLTADIACDDLTRLAAAVAQTPVALLCLLDASGVRISSQVGLESAAVESYLPFCTQTIKDLENHDEPLLIVEDTLINQSLNNKGVSDQSLNNKGVSDQYFVSYKLISTSPQIRFYTAFPLVNHQGIISGVILAIDWGPRELNVQQKEALKGLSRQASTQLALYTKVANYAGIATQYQELEASCQASHQELEELKIALDRYRSQSGGNSSGELSGDLICVISVDGYLKQVNSSFEKTLAYSIEELLDRAFLDFVHPEDRTITIAELEKLTHKTSAICFENRYRGKDGSYKWLSWNAFPLLEEEDMVYAIARDITKTKLRKASLLERSRVSTLEADIGAALVSQNGTLSESLTECTEAIIRHLHAIGAGIWTVERTVGNLSTLSSLELQGSTGQLLPAELFPRHVAPNQGIIGAIAQTRQSINTSLSTPGNDKIPSTFLSGYPLIVDARVVGVMALHSHQPFSQVVNGVLGWVANTMALAIDRVWAREELRSRREALLFQLASQIRNSLELDTILGTAVKEIRSLLRVDNCSFLWYFPDANWQSMCVTHEARNPKSQTLLGECPLPQFNPLVKIIGNLQPLRIEDIREGADLEPELRSLLTDWGMKSGLILPLKTQTGQLGAIICSNSHNYRLWSDPEVELLQGVVDQLAIAIEHAELFAKTRASALAAQTQARQLETALRDLRQTEALLIQTDKMSTIGQMVAGIAHEINNPVNFITGNLLHATNYIRDLLNLINCYQQHYPNPVREIQGCIEEIELDFLTEDLPKMMSSMQMGSDRINEIVVSLRNFSRVDQDEMKPANIHEGIDSTLLILRNRMKPYGNYPGITPIKEYGNLPLVDCYIGQLNQVFMNIISNAIDALEEARGEGQEVRGEEKSNISSHPSFFAQKIWIRTEVLKNNQVVIRIRDNGLGIPKNVLNRLFDPFFTTKPLGKGTGLGLSISHQIIVEKHGGVLQCISEPGKGTEFWISIPIFPPPRID